MKFQWFHLMPRLADLFDDLWEDAWWPAPMPTPERAEPREVAR